MASNNSGLKRSSELRKDEIFLKSILDSEDVNFIPMRNDENYFYEDPPPNFDSVIDYYSRVESDVTPSNIRIIQLSEKVYLTLYYLAGSYKYSNGRVDDEYQARVSNIWLYEDGGFKLYYKNFNKLKKELKPMDIIAYPMD